MAYCREILAARGVSCAVLPQRHPSQIMPLTTSALWSPSLVQSPTSLVQSSSIEPFTFGFFMAETYVKPVVWFKISTAQNDPNWETII